MSAGSKVAGELDSAGNSGRALCQRVRQRRLADTRMSSISKVTAGSRHATQSRSCCSLPRMISPRLDTAASTRASVLLSRCCGVLTMLLPACCTEARRRICSPSCSSCRSNSATPVALLGDDLRRCVWRRSWRSQASRRTCRRSMPVLARRFSRRASSADTSSTRRENGARIARPSMIAIAQGGNSDSDATTLTDSRLPTLAIVPASAAERLDVALAGGLHEDRGRRECGTSSRHGSGGCRHDRLYAATWRSASDRGNSAARRVGLEASRSGRRGRRADDALPDFLRDERHQRMQHAQRRLQHLEQRCVAWRASLAARRSARLQHGLAESRYSRSTRPDEP